MGIEMPEPGEEPWVILAVDYSAYGFGLGLYEMQELAIMETIDEVFQPYLEGAIDDESSRLDSLKYALRHGFDKPPQYKGDSARIEHLVLYGDLAKTDALHRLLESVLGSDLVERAHISDSPFSGTKYMAELSYNSMRWMHISGVQPAFGCRWRSRFSYQLRKEKL